MNRPSRTLLLAALVCCCAASGVYAQSRGELLYSTHCIACHTTQMHWRDRRLATDWGSLQAQVRQWQANAALGWREDDIVDATRYLNQTFYHFASPFDAPGPEPDAGPRQTLMRPPR